MLEVSGLEASYGQSQVLFGVTLAAREGEAVALLGRNGMGKTTTVRSIMGLLHPMGGEVLFQGRSLLGLPTHEIARRGIGLVPEGRRIFPNLTVRENLLMAARNGRDVADPWTLTKVVDFFPRLGERIDNGGAQLSGGEQQMLAIGRALMTNPLLLILDEATEGLAPLIRDEIWARLRQLRASGLTIVVIDKDVEVLADFADRHVILEKGQVAWSGDSLALTSEPAVATRFLAV